MEFLKIIIPVSLTWHLRTCRGIFVLYGMDDLDYISSFNSHVCYSTCKNSTSLSWQLSFQPIKSHTGQHVYALVRLCLPLFNYRCADWSPFFESHHSYHKTSKSKWRYPCSYQQSSLQWLKVPLPELFNSDSLNASSWNVATIIHPALMGVFATQLDIVETQLECKKL